MNLQGRFRTCVCSGLRKKWGRKKERMSLEYHMGVCRGFLPCPRERT